MNIIKRLFTTFKRSIPAGHKYFDGYYHGGRAEYYYIPSEGKDIKESTICQSYQLHHR